MKATCAQCGAPWTLTHTCEGQPEPVLPSGTPWTATYMQHGTEHTAEFQTLRGAVGFAVDGVETFTHAVKHLTGPGGQVIDGDELGEAMLHFQLGDEDHSPQRAAKWKPLLGH